jgi:hypothetical protein
MRNAEPGSQAARAAHRITRARYTQYIFLLFQFIDFLVEQI